MKSSGRFMFFDYLRVIALFGVLFIHLSGWFLKISPFLGETYRFLARASRFSVPMFVFIAAALFYLKYKKEKIDIRAYYRKRINKIIIPYIIVSAIYYIYELTPLVSPKIRLSFNGLDSLVDFSAKTLSIGTFSHLYFVPLIAMFYFLAPFIMKLYQSHKAQIIFGLISINFLFVLLMNQVGVGRLYWRWTVFPYLIYVALGFLFAENYEKIKKINKENILATLVVAIIAIIYVYPPYNGGTFELFSFSSYIYDSLFGIFWILFFQLIKFPEKANTFIAHLSEKSFGIYLFHYLFIDVIFSLLSKDYFKLPLNAFTYIMTLVIVMGVSAVSFWFVDKVINGKYKKIYSLKEGKAL